MMVLARYCNAGTTIRKNLLLGSEASTFSEKDNGEDDADGEGDVEMPSTNAVVEANINKVCAVAATSRAMSLAQLTLSLTSCCCALFSRDLSALKLHQLPSLWSNWTMG